MKRATSAGGIVVIILAICVGGSYAVALTVTVLQDGEVPTGVMTLLDTLGGLLGGALVAWLTSEWVHRRNAADLAAALDDVDERLTSLQHDA